MINETLELDIETRIGDGSLEPFIAYLETTTDDEWQTDTVRDKDNSKNCVMGHLINWAYGKDYKDSVSDV